MRKWEGERERESTMFARTFSRCNNRVRERERVANIANRGNTASIGEIDNLDDKRL